jgi:predicted metal-dependent hydrolase
VIIHELLHLRVPNHGPLFSALLRTHLASTSEGAE